MPGSTLLQVGFFGDLFGLFDLSCCQVSNTTASLVFSCPTNENTFYLSDGSVDCSSFLELREMNPDSPDEVLRTQKVSLRDFNYLLSFSFHQTRLYCVSPSITS